MHSTLEKLPSSYIREILTAATQSDVISFAGGLPDQTLFPVDLMGQSFEQLKTEPKLFQYNQSEGYQPLLDHLTQRYEVPMDQGVMITNGSQQGLDLIARAYINLGDEVLVEEPSYLGALQVFRLAKAKLLSISTTTVGPDLQALRKVFETNKIKFFYLIADFQNPTGIRYSLKVRKGVATLCEEFNVTIIEDAPYRDLNFSSEQLPLVSSFYPRNSLVLRSFSKSVCPGIRLGWVQAPKVFLQPLIKLKQVTDLHCNIPLQYVLLKVLEHPSYETNLKNNARVYKSKYLAMRDALESKFGDRIRVNEIYGGMFIWAVLKAEKNVNMIELASHALNHKVAIVPGCVFSLKSEQSEASIRLNFSHPTMAEIEEGVNRLAKSLGTVIQNS